MKSRKRKEPGYGVIRHEINILKNATEDQQRRAISQLSFEDALKFDADFEVWAHENQLPPSGEGWRLWLLMAGRGFGKTRAGAEWIFRLANGRPGTRVALIGATIADARTIMVEGVSGLLGIARRHRRRLQWEPGLGRLSWPNGSQAQLFSGDNADGLRGPEHEFAWADELAKWREADETWMNLRMGLRSGARPRALVTTTPKPIPLLHQIESDPNAIVTRGGTRDNINLDEKTIEILTATYGGTRIGDQELDGVLLKDFDGALWTRAKLAVARCAAPEAFDRIVIGVDPPAGSGPNSDACGIIVAGALGEQMFVIADASIQGVSPDGWASRVAMTAARWNAGLIVAEANNGGAMVESVLKTADRNLKLRLVHASRGKSARAEPIALRFEIGKAFLCGDFPELEAQLCGMISGGDYQGPGKSPDRADAMVWAMVALGETRSGVPRVRSL